MEEVKLKKLENLIDYFGLGEIAELPKKIPAVVAIRKNEISITHIG